MRIFSNIVVVLAVLLSAPEFASADRPGRGGFRGGHHHHGHRFHHHHRGFGNVNLRVGLGYGGLFSPYYSRSYFYSSPYYGWPRTNFYYSSGYDPYCYSGYGYTAPGTIYYRPGDGYLDYQLPAVNAPAELAYGPQAMNQFLGVDRRFGIGGLTRDPAEVAAEPARMEAALLEKLVKHVDGVKVIPKFSPPVSSAAARRRGERDIASGDESFRELKFHEALQKYKRAASAAPDLSEAHFRQGHALAATNRFELAAAAFKRALSLDPDLDRAGFTLDALYDGADVAKQSHLETMAGEALSHPDDSDLLFVLGVFLYYDDQADRAEKFFQRAAELTADREHLRKFLPALEADEPPAVAVRTAGIST